MITYRVRRGIMVINFNYPFCDVIVQVIWNKYYVGNRVRCILSISPREFTDGWLSCTFSAGAGYTIFRDIISRTIFIYQSPLFFLFRNPHRLIRVGLLKTEKRNPSHRECYTRVQNVSPRLRVNVWREREPSSWWMKTKLSFRTREMVVTGNKRDDNLGLQALNICQIGCRAEMI